VDGLLVLRYFRRERASQGPMFFHISAVAAFVHEDAITPIWAASWGPIEQSTHSGAFGSFERRPNVLA
jgi:hypothetical protein